MLACARSQVWAVPAALWAGVLLVMACGSVAVKPSSHGVEAASRPPGCSVEFLHDRPELAYDELGEMYSYFPWVAEPQDVLREKACALGADAVIVTRDFLISTRGPDRKLVAGIAIKYRESRGGPDRGRRGDRERGDLVNVPPTSASCLASLTPCREPDRTSPLDLAVTSSTR